MHILSYMNLILVIFDILGQTGLKLGKAFLPLDCSYLRVNSVKYVLSV